MQRWARRCADRSRRDGFNPHPAEKPDATRCPGERTCRVLACFNPHPAEKPDATRRLHDPVPRLPVSILIRLRSRMQRANVGAPVTATDPVSILIRLRSRMQPLGVLGPDRGVVVSILIRLRSRMQRGRRSVPCPCKPCFNPHPAEKPDATQISVLRPGGGPCFNPHPAEKPDATIPPGRRPSRLRSFNPHPAEKPDATPFTTAAAIFWSMFQSSSG